MKSQLLAGALIALGAPILASAQCTPSTFLAGQRWAFRLTGANVPTASINTATSAAIGTFTALNGGFLSATISIHQTQDNGRNLVSRLAPASGRWMVNDTCTGGMLNINMNGAFYQLTFVMANANTQMVLTGSDMYAGSWRGYSVSGAAKLNPPTSCGGAAPLTVLNGNWTYSLAGNGQSEIGSFTAILNNPAAYSGLLSINNRTITQVWPAPLNGQPPVLDQFGASGRYIVYSDCSGGELMFMHPLHPRQLEFVFTNNSFNEMYLVNDDMQPYPFSGVASK